MNRELRLKYETPALAIVQAIKREYLPDMDSNDGGEILSWILDLVETVAVPAVLPHQETAPLTADDRLRLARIRRAVEWHGSDIAFLLRVVDRLAALASPLAEGGETPDQR